MPSDPYDWNPSDERNQCLHCGMTIDPKDEHEITTRNIFSGKNEIAYLCGWCWNEYEEEETDAQEISGSVQRICGRW